MDTTNQKQTNSISQVPTPPQPATTFIPEVPVDPMDIKPENSVLNKTVSEGVDFAAETANASKQASMSNSTNFADTLNNEIVKPKMNYSLIAVVAGVLVLVITAFAYYFLVFSKQSTAPPATVETQPAVVEEIPVEQPPIVETPAAESDIGSDQVISQLNSVGNSGSTTQMQEELDSLDFDGIDTPLQLSDF